MHLLVRRNLLWDILRLPSSARPIYMSFSHYDAHRARTCHHTHCCIGARRAMHCATGDDQCVHVVKLFKFILYMEVLCAERANHRHVKDPSSCQGSTTWIPYSTTVGCCYISSQIWLMQQKYICMIKTIYTNIISTVMWLMGRNLPKSFNFQQQRVLKTEWSSPKMVEWHVTIILMLILTLITPTYFTA